MNRYLMGMAVSLTSVLLTDAGLFAQANGNRPANNGNRPSVAPPPAPARQAPAPPSGIRQPAPPSGGAKWTGPPSGSVKPPAPPSGTKPSAGSSSEKKPPAPGYGSKPPAPPNGTKPPVGSGSGTKPPAPSGSGTKPPDFRKPSPGDRPPVRLLLTDKDQDALITQLNNNKANLRPDEQASMKRLLAGTNLSQQDRDTLFKLLGSGRTGLTPAAQSAISQGLIEDRDRKIRQNAGNGGNGGNGGSTVAGGGNGVMSGGSAGGWQGGGSTVTGGGATDNSSGGQAVQPTAQYSRYLRVKNATGEKLTVYVQVQTLTDKNEWAWYPVTPGQEDKAYAYEFGDGEEAKLRADGWQVNGIRVRIWARSETGVWLKYKDEDLWLVPEKNADNENVYYASEMATFTFTFRP